MSNSIHNETIDNEHDANDSDIQTATTLRELLKTRPKTACAMDSVAKENIVKSKHEALVNILNVMETRRLRKSAFSPPRYETTFFKS